MVGSGNELVASEDHAVEAVAVEMSDGALDVSWAVGEVAGNDEVKTAAELLSVSPPSRARGWGMLAVAARAWLLEASRRERVERVWLLMMTRKFER